MKKFSNYAVLLIIFSVILFDAYFAYSQETAASDVSLLESRFSTTTPLVGESFKYFLKFDHLKAAAVRPELHFAEHGIEILETQQTPPQEFQGRVIEQYEYTLNAAKPGQLQFSPATLMFTGPRVNPVAAVADPAQLDVSSVVDVQVKTNSPLTIGDPLELSLIVTKRKPVTIAAMPNKLIATQQFPPVAEKTPLPETTAQPATTPTAAPQPAALTFTLDQSQQIAPQQTEQGAVETYRYLLAAQPTQAGEYLIPAFTIAYRGATGMETQQEQPETPIFVLNPNVKNADLKTDYRFLILPAIILSTVLFGVLIGLLYLKYRKPRSKQEMVVEPILPPGEVAHRELAEIEAMQLPIQGEFKQYYFLVSESVRKFLGAEYQFHVLERTTEEILQEIQNRDMPDGVKHEINLLLPEADMVKFAKYVPTVEQAEYAMQQAVRIVDESLAHPRSFGSSIDS
ncbi:hypothetical protein U14_00573 [Candidatus Moduliflexus flocculans]|uniref:Protein BatD n=1 Tax=Candidatus Moduliflexus flocculans TaxID=1499966 RepID=A0A0S6VQL9_9BACT|nr:hypothetical protein U14_00573 [Candidatus Moduliflexus flocculans]